MLNRKNIYNSTSMMITSLEVLTLGIIFLAEPHYFEYPGFGSQYFNALVDNEYTGALILVTGISGVLLSKSNLESTNNQYRAKFACLASMSFFVGLIFVSSLLQLANTGHGVITVILLAYVLVRICADVFKNELEDKDYKDARETINFNDEEISNVLKHLRENQNTKEGDSK